MGVFLGTRRSMYSANSYVETTDPRSIMVSNSVEDVQ